MEEDEMYCALLCFIVLDVCDSVLGEKTSWKEGKVDPFYNLLCLQHICRQFSRNEAIY